MSGNYIPPQFKEDAFHCPHCNTYAHQSWNRLGIRASFVDNPTVYSAACGRCEKRAYWIDGEMIYPKQSTAPLPSEDMPDDVRRDYLEARAVVEDSPRAAAALLRLAIEKLLNELSDDGGTTHSMIGDLVKDGRIDTRIQKALDSVRVIGNESVHPGELDMRDDKETALVLFELINTIVRTTLTEDKIISETYDKLPENKKKGIENRDS